MNITLICVGKLKERFFFEAAAEYTKRLSRFAKMNIIEIPDRKIPENASKSGEREVMKKEGELIIKNIPQNSHVIAMCIEGQEISSRELSEKINKISMEKSHITFIIGGSLGLWDEVKKRANERISFGPVTLPHQLMRIVLLEQIYRSFKILSNENYHK